MEKKEYIFPQMEIIIIETTSVLSASNEENFGEASDADAPKLIFMEDEPIANDHED